MPPLQIVANISGLILFGTTLVFAVAGNFLLKKGASGNIWLRIFK